MINSKSKHNNTGWKGIYFIKDTGMFRARLTIDVNYFKQIGNYPTLKGAIEAREQFIKNLF